MLQLAPLKLAACALLLAACAGAPDPPAPCLEGLPLTAANCAAVTALALPAQLPAAAGNRLGDDEEAARFGFLAFFDRRFSTIDDVSCASCHLPEDSFADARPVPEVIAGHPLARNAPTMLNASRMGPFFFWDGRADSLWSQPLFAIENPDEMASSRLALAAAVYDTSAYRTRYEALLGPMPDLSDSRRFPRAGKPGDAAYDAMAEDDRRAIDEVAANFGKMLEAYLRKVSSGASKLDRYLAGEHGALDMAEREGLRVFAERGCIECHSGSMLTDEQFHRVDGTTDRGRARGIEILLANPFNSRGAFFDAEVGRAPELPGGPSADDEHAFRTPSLRNIALTAPYGHMGQFESIADLLRSGHGDSTLSAQESEDLGLFLMALNGAYPERPWSDWPAR